MAGRVTVVDDGGYGIVEHIDACGLVKGVWVAVHVGMRHVDALWRSDTASSNVHCDGVQVSS